MACLVPTRGPVDVWKTVPVPANLLECHLGIPLEEVCWDGNGPILPTRFPRGFQKCHPPYGHHDSACHYTVSLGG